MAPLLDVATLYEHVLQASDDAEHLIADLVAQGKTEPPALVSLRVHLGEIEAQLQDIMDAQASRDAIADAKVHGMVRWEDFEAQLDEEAR